MCWVIYYIKPLGIVMDNISAVLQKINQKLREDFQELLDVGQNLREKVEPRLRESLEKLKDIFKK